MGGVSYCVRIYCTAFCRTQSNGLVRPHFLMVLRRGLRAPNHGRNASSNLPGDAKLMKINSLDSRGVRIIVIANACLPRNSDCAPQSCGLFGPQGPRHLSPTACP